MSASLYFVELIVADVEQAATWYREALGLEERMRPADGRFALLSAGPARVALKQGRPVPGGVSLAFEVEGIDGWLAQLAGRGVAAEGPVETSAEGYRWVRLRDPDGYAVVVFEWAEQPPARM